MNCIVSQVVFQALSYCSGTEHRFDIDIGTEFICFRCRKRDMLLKIYRKEPLRQDNGIYLQREAVRYCGKCIIMWAMSCSEVIFATN